LFRWWRVASCHEEFDLTKHVHGSVKAAEAQAITPLRVPPGREDLDPDRGRPYILLLTTPGPSARLCTGEAISAPLRDIRPIFFLYLFAVPP
jgi:hypothetical protein